MMSAASSQCLPALSANRTVPNRIRTRRTQAALGSDQAPSIPDQSDDPRHPINERSVDHTIECEWPDHRPNRQDSPTRKLNAAFDKNPLAIPNTELATEQVSI